jgi:hypothetical protein
VTAVLALASDHVTFWWITLGLGAVVLSAAILLLFLLLLFVKDVDAAVADAWQTAGAVATQTASLWTLAKTAELARVLRDEAARHDALFERAAAVR